MRTTILFRIPFTRIFIGFVSDGTFTGSWFDFFKKDFNGEYYWREI